MTNNKSIEKIVITHKDGTVSTVSPDSGHSIIISLDCGGSIAQVVSGKLPELCGLLDSIHTQNPEILARLTAAGEITPNEFREITGLSRKFMIPLLEYFDSTKLTIRVGDKRVLRK